MPTPNKYRNEIKKFEKVLKKTLANLLEKKLTFDQIKNELNKLSKDYKISSKLQEMFLQDAISAIEKVVAEAEKELNWKNSKTADLLDKASAKKLMSQIDDEFSRIGKKIDTRVLRAVSTALSEGKSVAQITEAISKATGLPASMAWSAANTGVAAMDRATTANIAKDAGIEKMKYVGGPPQRAFCSSHINNSYTIAEIESMSNGQGLSVLQFGGGWNCQHFWVWSK